LPEQNPKEIFKYLLFIYHRELKVTFDLSICATSARTPGMYFGTLDEDHLIKCPSFLMGKRSVQFTR